MIQYLKFQKINPIMYILKTLQNLLCYSDLFYSSELLRFNNNTQYKTITGGLITILIIVLVTVGFASMISDTLNRTAITFSMNIQKSTDPAFFQIVTDKDHQFMFGISIMSMDMTLNVDLNNGPRYFDVTFNLLTENYGVNLPMSSIPLVQCTDEHWALMPNVVQKSQHFAYSTWMCPKIGQKIPIQGMYTSQIYLLPAIWVSACNNDTDPSRPCAPQEQIDRLMDAYQNFYLSIVYTNPVISPTETEYLHYYLEGGDYVIFSKTQGVQSVYQMADFTITTDNSIWPYSDYTVDTGGIIQNKATNHPFSYSNYSGYANIYFSKSPNSIYITREVQKISAVFSYIGGLVGALTAVLFLLKKYTDLSFEVAIAKSLFQKPSSYISKVKIENKEKQAGIKQTKNNCQNTTFNFFTFLSLMVYQICQFFKFTKQWKKCQYIQNIQKQITHQLDVNLILQRMIDLENSVGCLFENYQLQGFRYRKSIDVTQAMALRQQFVAKIETVKDQNSDMNGIQLESIKENQISPYISTHRMDLKSPTVILKRRTMLDSLVRLKKQQQIRQSQKHSKQDESVFVKDDQLIHISQQSLRQLKILKKKAKNNTVNQRIWNNLDEQIKLYVQELPDNVTPERELNRQKKKEYVIFEKINSIDKNPHLSEE